MAEKIWKGTVSNYETGQRLENCFIHLTGVNQSKTLTTDDDGDYNTSLDDSVEWAASFVHKNCLAHEIEKVDLSKDENILNVQMHPIHSKNDEKSGKRFLYILSGILIALMMIYIIMHTGIRSANEPLSKILTKDLLNMHGFLDTLSTQKSTLEENTLNSFASKSDSLDLQAAVRSSNDSIIQLIISQDFKDYETLLGKLTPQDDLEAQIGSFRSAIQDMENIRDQLRANMQEIDSLLIAAITGRESIPMNDKQVMLSRWNNIKNDIKVNDFKDAHKKIRKLNYLVQHPPSKGYIPWNKYPWYMLEILFWAFAGILSIKILESGYYLRKRSFYRSGIFMHLSQIIAIPFMVLVSVMLLSLVSFHISIPGSEGTAVIDLSNSTILSAISFILAFSPWGVRSFIENTAERMTGDKHDPAHQASRKKKNNKPPSGNTTDSTTKQTS